MSEGHTPMRHTQMRGAAAKRSRLPAPVARRRRTAGRTAKMRCAAGGLGALALLAFSALALVATLATTVPNMPATLADGAAVATADGWIALRSTAPDDVLAAVRQSPLLAQSADGQSTDPARLGAPVLVHGLAARSGSSLPDVFVIPLLDGAGRATEAAEADLNSAHTALHVTTIVTFARPHSPALATLSAAAAVAQARRARHVGLRPGRQPELIYFPADAQAQVTGRVVWRAGGEDPADPIWRVPAVDGRDYFVGANGAVYALDQLPRAASL